MTSFPSVTDLYSTLTSLDPVPTPRVLYFGVDSVLDSRVRISMFPESPKIFYKDTSNVLLNPLLPTNGVVFPFQPTVDISFGANYQEQKVIHNNFTFNSYQNSDFKSMTLTGSFPTRTQTEGQYVIAALQFLRCLTMMFTGNDEGYGGVHAGSPPLIVRLSGMGFGGLDYIPVVVTEVKNSYSDNVDYVTIQPAGLNGEITKLPSIMDITVSVTPIFSRAFSSAFSLQAFAKGFLNGRLMGPVIPPRNPSATPISTTSSPSLDDASIPLESGPAYPTYPITDTVPTPPFNNGTLNQLSGLQDA